MDDENWETDAVMVAAAPAPAELPEVKLFGRWSCEDVQVSDMSLQVCCSFHLVLFCIHI